ncbi:hypothetical protein EBU71_05295 [bacterium]|nr:hypothetical protein [Candidatus Elulimicrobium humile]
MGLFNYIKVEQELPLDATLKTLNHNWRDEEYQTKELEESSMVTYIIRDNKLYEEVVEGHWQEITPEEKKRDGKIGLFWNERFVRDKTEQVWRQNYTGTFTFGCVVYGDTIDSTDFYPDWRCVVVNGEVKELTILPEYSKYSSKDRIEQQIEWDKEKETHDRKMKCPVYSFYFNYYVKPMDKFGWYVSRKLYSIIKLVEWIRFYGIRKLITFLTPR